MNRRGFIGALIGGVATAAAVRTWPFRVYSFPSEVIPPAVSPNLQCIALQLEQVRKQILVLFEKEQVFMTKFQQEGRVDVLDLKYWGRGSGSSYVVTKVDEYRKIVTLEAVRGR